MIDKLVRFDRILDSGSELAPNMTKHWSKHKIFEKHTLSRIFGLPLAGVAMTLSLVTYPTHAFDYERTGKESVWKENLIPVTTTTNNSFVFPLEMTLGMSQGFHALHPAVDLRAPTGTSVLSIAEGTVIEVEKMLVGYGHYVRVAHNGTMASLYAHLDQVHVVPGQKINKGEQLGTVGMTGWTTGPHLHFEITVGDRTVSPLSFIGRK